MLSRWAEVSHFWNLRLCEYPYSLHTSLLNPSNSYFDRCYSEPLSLAREPLAELLSKTPGEGGEPELFVPSPCQGEG
jgi:hypothetical protein